MSGLQAGDVCGQEDFFHRYSKFRLSPTLEGGAPISWHVLSVFAVLLCCTWGKELEYALHQLLLVLCGAGAGPSA